MKRPKTKIWVITLHRPIPRHANNKMNQSELEASIRMRQAREHACDQVTIGLSFGSDCLRERCEFF